MTFDNWIRVRYQSSAFFSQQIYRGGGADGAIAYVEGNFAGGAKRGRLWHTGVKLPPIRARDFGQGASISYFSIHLSTPAPPQGLQRYSGV